MHGKVWGGEATLSSPTFSNPTSFPFGRRLGEEADGVGWAAAGVGSGGLTGRAERMSRRREAKAGVGLEEEGLAGRVTRPEAKVPRATLRLDIDLPPAAIRTGRRSVPAQGSRRVCSRCATPSLL